MRSTAYCTLNAGLLKIILPSLEQGAESGACTTDCLCCLALLPLQILVELAELQDQEVSTLGQLERCGLAGQCGRLDVSLVCFAAWQSSVLPRGTLQPVGAVPKVVSLECRPPCQALQVPIGWPHR